MSLVTVLDAHLAYGDHPLLDGARFALQAGERVGLIGRNGTGKSTLLKVIAGKLQLDDGELHRRDGLRIAFVEQEPLLPAAQTIGESLVLLAAERSALARATISGGDRDEWRFMSRLTEYLHRFDLDAERSPDTTSGGERKRAALALALAHAHFGAGALEAAEREFRDAVALEPQNPDAHCGLVVTLANLFRLDEAERELHAAEQSGVRLSPSVRGEIEKRRGAGPS